MSMEDDSSKNNPFKQKLDRKTINHVFKECHLNSNELRGLNKNLMKLFHGQVLGSERLHDQTDGDPIKKEPM
jgi:hypothetical protein